MMAWLLGLLAISMLGSAVNLPVARLPAEIIRTARIVTVLGVPYLIPEVENGRAHDRRSHSGHLRPSPPADGPMNRHSEGRSAPPAKGAAWPNGSDGAGEASP